jgi:hypothetical protein
VQGSTTTSDSVHSAKKKRKNNEILLDAFHSSAVTDKKRLVMDEKRLNIDDERNVLLKEQVAAAKQQAAAVQRVCNAETLHKLTQDQSLLRQQHHEYRTMLVNRFGSRQELKRRMKAHQQRKAKRSADDDGSSSEESNASIMDDMEDISDRLKRIQQDILDHYNEAQNNE